MIRKVPVVKCSGRYIRNSLKIGLCQDEGLNEKFIDLSAMEVMGSYVESFSNDGLLIKMITDDYNVQSAVPCPLTDAH